MTLGALALPSAILRSEPKQPVEVQRICGRMLETDQWRNRTLLGYSGMRRYTLGRGHAANCGEMLVKVEYTYPGHKTFQVISDNSSGFVQDHVFRRVIDVEVEACRDEIRDNTKISPRNYEFQVLGSEDLAGRPAYVIRIKPRRKARYLVDGRIWVDAEDAAVARIDGEISTSSFWVRSSHMVQQYTKIGPYWLVVSNENKAAVRFLGEARLHIDYFDYQLRTS